MNPSSAWLFVSALLIGPRIHTEWIFVSNPIRWQTPASELNKTYDEGPGILAVFFPAGDFAGVSGTLFRDRDSGILSLCGGCGFSVRRGRWSKLKDGLVRIDGRWIRRDLQGNRPDAFVEVGVLEGRAKGRLAARIKLDSYSLVPLDVLANPDLLEAAIREGDAPADPKSGRQAPWCSVCVAGHLHSNGSETVKVTPGGAWMTW